MKTKDDKQRLFKMLLASAELVNRALTPEALEMWWSLMSEYEINDVSLAFRKHALDPERGRFFPTPSDIVAKLLGDRTDRKDAGEFAWQRVMGAMADHGSYASVAFDDPAIHYAISVAFGSWVRIGQLSADDPFPRKDFCTAYAAFKQGLGYPEYFPGIAETNNASENFDAFIPKISFVGDADKVEAVMMAGRVDSRELTHASADISEIREFKEAPERARIEAC